MKNTINLTLEELDRRIAHFEYRLKDFIYFRGTYRVYQRNAKRTKER